MNDPDPKRNRSWRDGGLAIVVLLLVLRLWLSLE